MIANGPGKKQEWMQRKGSLTRHAVLTEQVLLDRYPALPSYVTLKHATVFTRGASENMLDEFQETKGMQAIKQKIRS